VTLVEALGVRVGDVVALVGGGGKTTVMFRLAREVAAQGAAAWCPGACLLNEADGSRGRGFKAPAPHESAIPPETTLVVPVVGADVFGQPLEAEHVHRARREQTFHIGRSR
jgi:YqeC protein